MHFNARVCCLCNPSIQRGCGGRHLLHQLPEIAGGYASQALAVDAVQRALQQHTQSYARTHTHTLTHTHSCVGISACHYVKKITEDKASLTPIRPAASTSPPATQPVILMTFSSLSRLKNRVICHMSHNPMKSHMSHNPTKNEVTCHTSHNPSHRALVQAASETAHVSLQVYAHGCNVAVSGSDLMAGADCR